MFLSIKPFKQHFLTWCSTFHWQKAPNNARPPDTWELRWKALLPFLCCVKNNIILLLLYWKVCIFARFKVSCDVMPLRSFANVKLLRSRHKELRGAAKARDPGPWPIWSMRKSVTGRVTRAISSFLKKLSRNMITAMQTTATESMLIHKW